MTVNQLNDGQFNFILQDNEKISIYSYSDYDCKIKQFKKILKSCPFKNSDSFKVIIMDKKHGFLEYLEDWQTLLDVEESEKVVRDNEIKVILDSIGSLTDRIEKLENEIPEIKEKWVFNQRANTNIDNRYDEIRKEFGNWFYKLEQEIPIINHKISMLKQFEEIQNSVNKDTTQKINTIEGQIWTKMANLQTDINKNTENIDRTASTNDNIIQKILVRLDSIDNFNRLYLEKQYSKGEQNDRRL